jgi:hypothetical protein
MAATQPQIAGSPKAQKRVVWGLATVFLTYFVCRYFFQILFSALPRITADLGGMPWYAWGVSIPSLGLVFSMLTFLAICTLPQISMDVQVEDKRTRVT